MIYRLSFGVPSNLLSLLANGLVIGKILAAAPAAIPFKLVHDDRAANLVTENINRLIKSVGRTITVLKICPWKGRSSDPKWDGCFANYFHGMEVKKKPRIPLAGISSLTDPSWGILGPSIQQMLPNQYPVTCYTSWLGPGTRLPNSIPWPVLVQQNQ